MRIVDLESQMCHLDRTPGRDRPERRNPTAQSLSECYRIRDDELLTEPRRHDRGS